LHDVSVKSDRSFFKSKIPNVLSLSRIVIAPFLFLSIKANDLPLTIGLSLFALLSDYLDGVLARKYGSISESGKILDPLADKLCIALGALALTLYGDMPIVLLIIVIARDLGIAIIGVIIIREQKQIPVSNKMGKVTVLILSLALLVYVFKLSSLYDYAFIAAILFVILSSLSYLHQLHKFFSK
jgi:CDP-diacylglycerol--glycerol-3-phosphate 3-phosphatidyltransferase